MSKSLSPSLRALRPAKSDVDRFISDLQKYFERIDSSESEENLKTHLMDLFKATCSPTHLVEQQGRIDFVIRTGGKNTPAAILVEAKREANKADMIRKDDINRKALHELILYFMQERKSGNTDIQYLIICTEHEVFIFEAFVFERNFQRNVEFRKNFEAWDTGKKSDSTTDFFYRDVAAPFIAANNAELEAVYLDLRTYQSKLAEGAANKELLKLFKLLSPHFLLNQELANDSNSLNKTFYDELLHLIGLEEHKEKSKRIIRRLEKGKRNQGSLLENTAGQVRYEDDFNAPEIILEYGSSNEERELNIALELSLTWVNRLLFLKLLEAQIFKFHGQDDSYKFLSTAMVADFDDLSDLFFKVLAFSTAERPSHVRKKYVKVPYLNSSLFELTPLEKRFRVNSLNNGLDLPLFKKTILKNALGRRLTGEKNSLSYIFEFLDAFDFGAVGGGDVQEESKTIINAAVLGLIFEKINGYRDGAIFTPGYITMYMANRAIKKLVLEAFQLKNPSWKLNDLRDLRNYLADERSRDSVLKYNSVIDSLKICDPAVGSGHFLVSCLNELIAVKSRLGILADSQGNRLLGYVAEVDNDELIIMNADTDEVFDYQVNGDTVPKNLQHVQETIFHEKQKLIENCLFGVDINVNSVRICQLRLWIELLKSAYYLDGKDGQLETLPNIDINIKCGNSLLSRFRLDQNLSDAFNRAGLTVSQYRKLVNDYKNTKDKSVKRNLQEKIALTKTRFQEEALGRLTKKIDAEIATLRAKKAQTELFEFEKEHQNRRTAKLEGIRNNIAKLEQERKKLLQNKTFLGAMEWRFEFPEVLDEKNKFIGFDLVIANPPYGVSISDPVRSYITKTLGKVPDYEIYYLFLNLSSAIAKKEGSTCQIIPNTILFNFYAKSYREQLLHDWRDIQIDDLTDYPVFDGVVVHNIIFHARRRSGYEGARFKRTGQDLDVLDFLKRDTKFASAQTMEQNIRNWALIFKLEPAVMSLVFKIRNAGSYLQKQFPLISQGLIAYDQYRGQTADIIKARAYHGTQKSKTNSPWLKGEDVTRYCVNWNGKEYIEYSDQLANPRKPEFFQQPRILVREITNPRIFAGYTKEVLYNDPALIIVLTADDQNYPAFALLGILNSKLASFYHFNSSPKATKGAFPKILVNDIKSFPLPEYAGKIDLLLRISERTARMVELGQACNMSDEFRELDKANEKDVMCAYGVLDEERQIIDNYFENLSRNTNVSE